MKTSEPNDNMFSSQTFCDVCKVGVDAKAWNSHIKSVLHEENLKKKEFMEKYLRENKMCIPLELCV